VSQVAPRLARQGFRVSVLTTDLDGSLSRIESDDGVEIRRVRTWPSRGDYYFAPEIYGSVVRGDWDLVHVQSYHTFVAPLAMSGSLRARLPYVLTFHGGGHSSRLRHAARPVQRAFLRPLLARAARLIGLTEFEIDFYSAELRLPRERFAVIPNGSELAVARDAAPPIPGDATLIVSLGRLERYKGHQRVLAALPHVLARIPDARLWIAGAGPYEQELRKRAARLRVEDHVQIRAVPPEQRDELARQLTRASLVCLLSEFETHPIAALETLALGRPLLVADAPGLRELAAQGMARAVSLDATSEEIAAAILEELATPRTLPPVHLPSWDDCASALGRLYREVIAERR
jgi:glycosyltransferase involved in cell wall biosynthesis